MKELTDKIIEVFESELQLNMPYPKEAERVAADKILQLFEQPSASVSAKSMMQFTQMPAEYFESRNGGKSAEKMMEDEEMLTPIYALAMISEYILDCCEFSKESVTDEKIVNHIQSGIIPDFNGNLIHQNRWLEGYFEGAKTMRDGKIKNIWRGLK